jgi:Ser/Thr protein kinase RdoA (MazF antagonist)
MGTLWHRFARQQCVRCLQVNRRRASDDGRVTEHVLTGGNVADRVVRVGDTVRKPATDASPAVAALLRHLDGFSGSPRMLGTDDAGRQVLEYIPGELADTRPPMSDAELRRVGRLIRDLHDAVVDFRPPPDANWQVVIPPDRDELICHHDLAPWNLVVDGDRWVFIDWDGAGPGSRLWDLAYAAHGFLPLHPRGDPTCDGLRLRSLVDGYDLDERQRGDLPELIGAHTLGMFELLRDGARTGTQPWARLHAAGHADHWGPAADYIDRHVDVFRSALLA